MQFSGDIMEGNQQIKHNEVDSGLAEDIVLVPDHNPSQSISPPIESNQRSYDLSKIAHLSDLIRTEDEELIKKEIELHVKKIINTDDTCKNYNTIFLFDISGSINRNHADCIYSEIQSFKNKKILFFFYEAEVEMLNPLF